MVHSNVLNNDLSKCYKDYYMIDLTYKNIGFYSNFYDEITLLIKFKNNNYIASNSNLSRLVMNVMLPIPI